MILGLFQHPASTPFRKCGTYLCTRGTPLLCSRGSVREPLTAATTGSGAPGCASQLLKARTLLARDRVYAASGVPEAETVHPGRIVWLRREQSAIFQADRIPPG